MADSHEASPPIDPAYEARALRTYAAICRPGRDYQLSPRWVDVMPAVTARDLLSQVRAERAEVVARRWHRECERIAREATVLEDDERRERHRLQNRASWLRKKARLYGDRTREDRAAEREAAKAATRTPEQQQRHEWYLARREEILRRAREKRAKE